jgi:ACS family hexuronate transporter-like MFS transporter
LCVIWWSAAAMLHGAVRSALQLGAARFLLGLAQAGNWPGGVKAVSEWFPLRERAFAVGLFNSGSTVGAMVAPPLVAALALTFGWRLAFVITGATGFLWLAAWLVLYKAPERHPWLRREELELIQSDRAPETRQLWRPLGLPVAPKTGLGAGSRSHAGRPRLVVLRFLAA